MPASGDHMGTRTAPRFFNFAVWKAISQWTDEINSMPPGNLLRTVCPALHRWSPSTENRAKYMPLQLDLISDLSLTGYVDDYRKKKIFFQIMTHSTHHHLFHTALTCLTHILPNMDIIKILINKLFPSQHADQEKKSWKNLSETKLLIIQATPP